MQDVGVLKQIDLKIKISIAALLSISGLFLCLLFYILPDEREILKFVSAVIGGMATIYSAFYIGKTLQTQIERSAMEKSFELINQFNDINFMEIRSFIMKGVYDQNTPPNEFCKLISDNRELDAAVKKLLHRMETLSIAIQEGYVNEKILYLNFKTLVVRHFNTFRPFVEEERKKFNSNTLYSQYEKLSLTWENKKYLFSNKIIQ